MLSLVAAAVVSREIQRGANWHFVEASSGPMSIIIFRGGTQSLLATTQIETALTWLLVATLLPISMVYINASGARLSVANAPNARFVAS